MSDAAERRDRLDKWIWHARFIKTRSAAAKFVAAGKVRVNGVRVTKPAQNVTAGDTLTFPQGSRIRVIRVRDFAERRGSAPEAARLYEDLAEVGTDGETDVPDQGAVAEQTGGRGRRGRGR